MGMNWMHSYSADGVEDGLTWRRDEEEVETVKAIVTLARAMMNSMTAMPVWMMLEFALRCWPQLQMPTQKPATKNRRQHDRPHLHHRPHRHHQNKCRRHRVHDCLRLDHGAIAPALVGGEAAAGDGTVPLDLDTHLHPHHTVAAAAGGEWCLAVWREKHIHTVADVHRWSKGPFRCSCANCLHCCVP